MFSQISILLLTLLSQLFQLNSGSLDFVELVERIGLHDGRHEVQPEPLAAVQVELLPDPEGAETLADRIAGQLERSGSELEVFVETVPGEAELPPSYRVVIGPFAAFEEAERARAELDELGIDGFVRELDDVIGC